MFFVNYENGQYKVMQKDRLDDERVKNIYKDEGKFTCVQYTINQDFLPKDNSKGKEYNDAIDAYSKYVNKKARELLGTLNESNYNATKLTTVIKDLNNDDIPEILLNEAFLYPAIVYTYKNNEMVQLLGATSNGMHGFCGLLENGMYASYHLSTGWETSFVTYNSNGTQTIENFSSYDKASYSKCTVNNEQDYKNNKYVNNDYYTIEFEKSKKGEEQFNEKYKEYEKALENAAKIEEQYSPYVADKSLNYSPYILERINSGNY